MEQLNLMPLIEAATRKERNREALIADLDYETDCLMKSATDGLLVLGDTFSQDNREFTLIGFQVKAIEIDGDPIFETYYQFQNPAGEKNLMHTDRFLKLINNRQWTPKAPDDCVFYVNSLIFGTPEFNEKLKWDLVHYG